MADITTTFRYNGDFGPLRSQIKALSKDISALNLQFKTFETSAKTAMLGAAKGFMGDVAGIKGYKSSIVDLTSTIDRFGMALSKGKLSLREYTKEAANAFSSTSKTRQLAEREVAKLQSTFVELGNLGGRRKGMLATPLALDMTNLSNKVAVARKQYEIFNKLVHDGANKLIDFGKNTQWAGRQLAVGLTLPIVTFGQTLAKTFLDAESELTRFAKVYGSDLVNQSYESTEAMKKQVIGLSKTIAEEFGVAVKETNALAADLAAAGYEGQQLLDMVTQTSRLAILGEVNRQDAMKATLSLQTAFNMNTQQLSDSINFLNSVENQTSTSLQDLITAIPRTGPIMNAMGGNVKDLAALLVAMKEGGVGAAEGANALKSGLASLINPTKKASEFAKQYGIDLQGIIQSTHGELMPTILAFQGALKNLDEFGRARVIEEIFGKYQFARISALFDNLNQQGSQTQKVLELAKMSTTDLAKQAYREMRILTDSAPIRLKRGVEKLKAELMPIGATIVQNIIPVVQAVGKFVGRVVNFLQKLPGPLKTFLKFSAAASALLGPIVMLVGLFANFGGNVVKLVLNLFNLGRAMLGIKTDKFKFLDDDALAASLATDGLTKSFFNQKMALGELNVALTTYIARLNEIKIASPGLMMGPGKGPVPMVRRAEGGYIAGPGGPRDDKIPAYLSNGEYVIKASSVDKYGTGTLDQINAGKFADGGIVGYQHGTDKPISANEYRMHNGEKLQRGHIGTSGFINMMPESINRRLMSTNSTGISARELAVWFSREKGYSLMAGVGQSLGMNEQYIQKSIRQFQKMLVEELLKNPSQIYGGYKKGVGLNFEQVVGDKVISEFSKQHRGWSILNDVKHVRTKTELDAVMNNPKYSQHLTTERKNRILARLLTHGEGRTAGVIVPNKLVEKGITSYVGTKGGGGKGLYNFLLKGMGALRGRPFMPVMRANGGMIHAAGGLGIFGLLARQAAARASMTPSAIQKYLMSGASRYQGHDIENFFATRAAGAKGNIDLSKIMGSSISASSKEELAMLAALEAHASGEFGNKAGLRALSQKEVIAGTAKLQKLLAQHKGDTVRLYRVIRTNEETGQVGPGHYGYTAGKLEESQPYMSFTSDLSRALKFANVSGLGITPRVIEMDVPKSAIVGIQGVNYKGNLATGSENEFIVMSSRLPEGKRYLNLHGFAAAAHPGSKDPLLRFLTPAAAPGEREFLIRDILSRFKEEMPMFLGKTKPIGANEYFQQRHQAYISGADRPSNLAALEPTRQRIFGVTQKEIEFSKRYLEMKYGMPFSELKKVKHDVLFKDRYNTSTQNDYWLRTYLRTALGYEKGQSYTPSQAPGQISAAFSSPMISRASGGSVYGAGGPTDDKIPAMLSNGEYVIQASAVEKYGPNFMDNLNAGRFAKGGVVYAAKGVNTRGYQRAHIGPGVEMRPSEAKAFLDLKGIGIQPAQLKKIQTMIEIEARALAAGMGDAAVKMKLLGNLVMVTSTTVNQDLKEGGVAFDTFMQDFNKIGRARWMPAMEMIKQDVNEFGSVLDRLDLMIAENIKAQGGMVTDAKLHAAYQQAHTKLLSQVNATEAAFLTQLDGLSTQFSSFRATTTLTQSEMAALQIATRILTNTKGTVTAIEVEGMKQQVLFANKTEKLNSKIYERTNLEQVIIDLERRLASAEQKLVANTGARAGAPVAGTAVAVAGGAAGKIPGGGMQGLTMAAMTLGSLPFMFQGLATAGDGATKSMYALTIALQGLMTLGMLRSMLPGGGVIAGAKALTAKKAAGNYTVGRLMAEKGMTTAQRQAVLSRASMRAPLATGIGGAMQKGGTSLMAKGAAKTAAGAGMRGAAMTGIGRGMTALGPALANPYVLGAVALVAVVSASAIIYHKRHMKALKEAREYGKAAWGDATEAAKRYGYSIMTANKAIEKNKKLAGDAGTKKSKKIADKDLEYVVKKDFSNAVKNVVSGTAEEAQTELQAVLINLVSGGAPKEAAMEIINEIARQAGRSDLISKEFAKSFMDVKDIESAANKATTVFQTKISDAMNKFANGHWSKEQTSIAVGETIAGALDTATKIAASDPGISAQLISSLFDNKTAVDAAADELVTQFTTRLATAGLGPQTVLYSFMGNKENIGTDLSQQILIAMSLGVDLAKVEKEITNLAEDGATKRIAYMNAEQSVRLQTQEKIADYATEKKKILVREQKDASDAFEDKKKLIEEELKAEDIKHQNLLDKIENERKALERRKEIIEKNADDYIAALQKQQDAEDFYKQQRDTTLQGLKALAGGDVFGFAQAQADLQTQAESKGRQDTIDQIEQTKQAAVDAIDARLRGLDDEVDKENTRHQTRIDNLNAETEAVIAQQNKVNAAYQQSIDLLSEMQTSSLTQQQILMGKWQKLYTGKDSPVEKVRESTKFFDRKTQVEIQKNANDLQEIFETVPGTMTAGLESGIKTYAEQYHIPESALRGALYGSLSKNYNAEIAAQKLTGNAALPGSVGMTGGLSLVNSTGMGPFGTNADAARTGQRQLAKPPKTLVKTSQASKSATAEEKASLLIWEKKEDIPDIYKSDKTSPMTVMYNGKPAKYYINRLGHWARSRRGVDAEVGGAFNFVSAHGWASGGHITGPGTSRSDSIPAMLSNGEYVVNAAAVQKYGLGTMDAINSGAMPMAMGGFAGARQAARYANGGNVGSITRPIAGYNDGGLVAPTYNTPQAFSSAPTTVNNSMPESNVTYNTITINANSADAKEVYNEFQKQMARYERGTQMGRNM